MDLSFLPNILALSVFIVAFRPFVRRVGAHVHLWFLGWSFILVRLIALSFAAPSGHHHAVAAFIALWALEGCGLAFVMAAAGLPTCRIGLPFTLSIALPVLLQSALSLAGVSSTSVHISTSFVFLAPSVFLLLSKQERSRQVFVLAGAFAFFALCTPPLAFRHPDLVSSAALSMLFLLAAYLYLTASQTLTFGRVTAVCGLALWGLSFPTSIALSHFYSQVFVDRALLELPQLLVITGIVVTLLEEYVRRTERMAMHDALTDLPNLRLFEERLIAAMTEARINRSTVACLVIDVDNFKMVNDTLGHDAGDQLLRALAVRLSWHMSPRDILARTGGDEFMALLAGVNDENHLRFIAGAMMSAASVPIVIDGQSVDVRISIGLALSPDHADDIDSLRRAADQAMYSAKRRGGSLLAFAGEEQEAMADG